MSPQVLLCEPYTIKCDVWSCGIVFYKILFNLFPWEKTDNLNVLIDRMKGEILFPPNIKISGWLKDMIKGMLTVTEAERLSIKEVVEIIRTEREKKENGMDIE
jgi:serine/threonine protein kinase